MFGSRTTHDTLGAVISCGDAFAKRISALVRWYGSGGSSRWAREPLVIRVLVHKPIPAGGCGSYVTRRVGAIRVVTSTAKFARGTRLACVAQNVLIGRTLLHTPSRRGTVHDASAGIRRVLIPLQPRRGGGEHGCRGRAGGASPCRFRGDYAFVEGGRCVEHPIEVCDGTDVPGANVLVKRRRILEHALHVRHRRRRP